MRSRAVDTVTNFQFLESFQKCMGLIELVISALLTNMCVFNEFCLPFLRLLDNSGCDETAHALQAIVFSTTHAQTCFAGLRSEKHNTVLTVTGLHVSRVQTTYIKHKY